MCEINYFFLITQHFITIISIIFAQMDNFTPQPTTPLISDEVRNLLISEARRINSPEFIASDPVQFPRQFSDLRDIEITAFIVAAISWGKRTMICRDAHRLLEMMDFSPYNYMLDNAAMSLPEKKNIHRTFFASHLQYYMRGLKRIYSRHSSLDAFCSAEGVGQSEAPAWRFAEVLSRELRQANNGEVCSQCVPAHLETTALKRINMALRWLVRNDGIVDLGVWHSIKPTQLFIPLDVHSAATSRQLGLLTRKSNDRKAVAELTSAMRSLNPDDPAIYDFALFGIGMGL